MSHNIMCPLCGNKCVFIKTKNGVMVECFIKELHYTRQIFDSSSDLECLYLKNYHVNVWHHYNCSVITNNISGKEIILNLILDLSKISLDKIKTYLIFS